MVAHQLEALEEGMRVGKQREMVAAIDVEIVWAFRLVAVELW